MKQALAFYSKMKKGEKRIFAVTAVILLVVFVDQVIILPITTSLSSLSSTIREQESTIRKSMNVLLHKETIEEEAKEYAQYSLEANNPEMEMVSLLKEVEAVAERSGASLLYVKPGQISDQKGTKKYYAIMECEGPMEQVSTFFHGIESSNKLLKIEKYVIAPKSKDSSLAKCQVTIYKTVLAKQ